MELAGLGPAGGNLEIARLRSVWLPASLALIAALAVRPGIARGQSTDVDSNSSTPKSSNSEKTKLNEVTRVSTDEAAKQAAKEKAKAARTSSPKSEDDTKKADQGNASSQVIELQPAKKASDDKGAGTPSVDEGKSNPKMVHGSVHGATGSGVRQGGGDVGTGTKSGKTHVYVETERTSTPQPH